LTTAPALDVREDGSDLVVTLEIPGVGVADVSILLCGDALDISGRKEGGVTDGAEHIRVAERSFGRFQRLVKLPFNADPKQVTATLEQGVLEVRFAKPTQVAVTVRIEVLNGDCGFARSGTSSEAGSKPTPSSAASTAQEGTAPGTFP
jgi:HSP20 family protein